MRTKRRERLEGILNGLKKLAKAQEASLDEVEPFELGGDPLRDLFAEVEDAWNLIDKLTKDMLRPHDSDIENALIIEWEHYVEEGNKEPSWKKKQKIADG